MPTNLSPSDISAFQAYIHRFYDAKGRTDLPWRRNNTPYQILVSEIMLQQTQVDRVIPKFAAFIERFPSTEKLANADVAEIIMMWQGLGYNRRVLNLQKAAQVIERKYEGQVPRELEELLKLPGIGPYTAPAVQAFAFNLPSIVIETNIRAVFLFHFFPGAQKVTDEQLLPLIEATLDTKQPRRWYSALMDYGSFLKSEIPNPSRQSKTYVKQSPFKGSKREVRGYILKVLSQTKKIAKADLEEMLGQYKHKSHPILQDLIKEGFVAYKGGQYSLPRS